MKCPECQLENIEGAKFCNECGAKLEPVCSKCGNANPPDSKFCNECGQELGKPVETGPVDYSQPQSYTPKHIAEEILTTRSSIEGERKLVTVLFADVAAFTSLSEKLDPEEAHQIMDGCFKILMDEIHKYEGTINQFTGDGVMALFGAPLAREDHAKQACYAALSIQKAIVEYGEKIKQDYGMEFRMRLGLNSGPVIVGSIGDDLRMDYTAVGDTTNTAARIESMAGPGTVLLSRNTHKIVRDFFEFEDKGAVEAKGKEEPLEAYELLRAGEVDDRIGASVARGLVELVGRRKELDNLSECFARAGAGQGQMVGVVGEAGVGKSRLILEFKKSIENQDSTYLEGRCVSFGQSIPYLPFIEIVKQYFDIREGDKAFAARKKISARIAELDAALTETVPFLCDLLSVPMDDSPLKELGAEEKRKLTFEAMKAIFLRESQARPLVITLENLHWIDKASQEFLVYMVEGIVNSRILLLGTYRPGYVHNWSGKSYYSHIALNPLSEEESADLTRFLLDIDEITADLKSLVLGRAEGNPLYVEEIVRWLIDSGALVRSEAGYVLKEKPAELAVPDTIQDVIMARIDRLEQDMKQTVQIASVIGRDFLLKLLTRISGMGAELQSYLAKLQNLEFIYEKSLFPELEYMFKHGLIQDVAYHSLLIKTRRQLHERIGNAMEDLYEDRLDEHYEELAHHYRQSDDQEKAVEYLLLAAKKAANRFANEEAMSFCEEALKILDKLPDNEANRKLKSDTEFLQLNLKAITDDIPPV